MSYYSISALINAVTSTVFGVLVILRNPKAQLNRSFSLFALTVAIWSYSYFFWQISDSSDEALFWCRSLMAGAIFIPATFLYLSAILVEQQEKCAKTIKLAFAISIIFFVLDFTKLFVKDVEKRMFFPYWPVPGITYPLFLITFILVSSYAHVLLFRFYKKSSGIKRNQIKYVFLGTAITFTGGSTNYFLWYNINIPPVGNIFASVYVVLTAYAILKHRLMDIRIAITRAGIFIVIFTLILGVPFWLGYKLLGRGVWFGILLFGMVLASLGPFVYNYLRGKAENILLKEQKRYQKALKDFASSIIFIKDIEELSKKVISEIMASVEVRFCAVYLKETDGFHLRHYKSNISLDLPLKIGLKSELISSLKNTNVPLLGEYLPKLDDIRLGIISPLFLKQELCGIVLLGPKRTGFYTDTDLDVFSILANQTSLALAQIYYFEEYQKTMEDKYKLILEKERLESAFQIAEAYRHEVGNAIQLISLNVDNFLRDKTYQPSKEELLKSLQSIGKNADRAQNILGAVSNYNEKVKTEFKIVELDKIVKGAIKEQEAFISGKGITLKTQIEDKVEVFGNENLTEAVKYLIEGAIGAIEYFLPKEKLIRIQLTNRDSSALLEVADTGNAVLTDKLYKGVGIERGKEGGIVYFIARRIIFDHKGTFEIETFDDGQGTKFIIEVPLKKK